MGEGIIVVGAPEAAVPRLRAVAAAELSATAAKSCADPTAMPEVGPCVFGAAHGSECDDVVQHVLSYDTAVELLVPTGDSSDADSWYTLEAVGDSVDMSTR